MVKADTVVGIIVIVLAGALVNRYVIRRFLPIAAPTTTGS
jgi:hypothetical protein